MSLITITSTLHNEEVERLKILMEEIDGVIIDDNIWRRASTYLTVGKAVLTLKVPLSQKVFSNFVRLSLKQFKNCFNLYYCMFECKNSFLVPWHPLYQ